jgi:hypothetical protein
MNSMRPRWGNTEKLTAIVTAGLIGKLLLFNGDSDPSEQVQPEAAAEECVVHVDDAYDTLGKFAIACMPNATKERRDEVIAEVADEQNEENNESEDLIDLGQTFVLPRE